LLQAAAVLEDPVIQAVEAREALELHQDYPFQVAQAIL
jgi:hypothetical protein